LPAGGRERTRVRGSLVALDGERSVPVSIGWLEASVPGAAQCDWLVGHVASRLEPGLWRFEPPASLVGEGEAGTSVEFRVPERPAAGSRE
jgi:hypothetical protein